MKRKELGALFNEVSSKCCPVRGIYDVPSTERERIISRELKKFREKKLAEKEKDALERLLLSQLKYFKSAEEFNEWFWLLKKRYSPEEIPDYIYATLMSIAHKQDFAAVFSIAHQELNKKRQ